jgi:hypothetical protein
MVWCVGKALSIPPGGSLRFVEASLAGAKRIRQEVSGSAID